MARTHFYKAAYFAEIAIVLVLLMAAVVHFQLSGISVALLIICLFIPGRVLGFFWRDLLRGLRLLKQRQYVESKKHSELFIAEVRKKPWLKKLIWLGSGVYSRDAEALALNNLGAAELKMGDFDAARRHLQESFAVDKKNPLCAFNMAILFAALGNQQESGLWLNESRRLGYSRSIIDRIVQSSETRFANIDGRGGFG